MRIEALDKQAFTLDLLRQAIKAAEKNTAPIKLLVKRGKAFETLSIDYHQGLRYPKLSRVSGSADRLDKILAPR
ncbi:MAG: peptidase M61, partial [Terriglobia bacterium]